MSAVRTLILGFVLMGVFSWVAVSEGQVPSVTPANPTPVQPGTAFPVPAPAAGTPNVYGGWNFRYSRPSSQESVQLAQQYVKTTKEDEKKKILEKLTEVLNQQFDQHIQQQQKELEDLEKQIADLRTLLKKRTDAKTKIVQRRIDQLVQEAEGLGWNSPASPHAPASGLGGVFAPKSPTVRPVPTPAPRRAP